MKMFCGYMNNYDEDNINAQYDIAINSCGRYEFIKRKLYKTHRPLGRKDFQLLYVAKGESLFTINGEEKLVKEGSIIIYHPNEPQYYCYNTESSPVIYWLHFSGNKAISLLEKNNLSNERIFFIGVKNELTSIFDKIIRELQLVSINYFQLCNLYIIEILTLCSRYIIDSNSNSNNQNKFLDDSIEFFNNNFNTYININDFARSCNISCCWFIRSFKEYTGTTPNEYITNIRINKAKALLNNTYFTVSEILALIGYENPLYFNRIFKKNVEIFPKDYRSKNK